MPQTIRFHLDEHCPHALAAGLRRHGIDVTTTPEAGLLHARDEEQIAYCVAEDRVLFTRDEDFLTWNARGVPHRGILFCHQRKRLGIGELIDALRLIWEVYEPDEMANRVEYL